MSIQINDNWQENEIPSTFEELEVRRALNKTRLKNPDVDAEWDKFYRDLQASGDLDAQEDEAIYDEQPARNRSLIYTIIGCAAAIIIALFILFPMGNSSSSVEVFTANKNEKDIIVSSEDGDLSVVKDQKPLAFNQARPAESILPEKVKMMELSTPRGKDCQMTLPDGTRVWLNADSKITFPNRFVGKMRNVKVEGEAYFEVTKDAQHPFIVSTDYFTTTVLGTVFNIDAYSAKTANVTLVSGSVAVKTKNGASQEITPGQMAKWNADGTMTISDVDVYPLTQWKDGFFYFNNDRLVDIMLELGRWYNVGIVFEHEEDMNRRLHFVAEHKQSLRDIIKHLNNLGVVKIEMNKDHVSVE